MNKLLNKGETSPDDLKILAKRLKVKLDGVYDINEITKLPKKGSFIVLLNKNSGNGHWIAIHNDTYYDSMGEAPPPKLKIKSWNDIQFQGTYDEMCGQFCLIWLYSKQNNVNLLKDMTDLNII